MTKRRRKTKNSLFQLGSQRTGRVLYINLPCGRCGTCIGATDYCDGRTLDSQGRPRFTCNGKRGRSAGADAVAYAERVLAATKQSDFATRAIDELYRRNAEHVRIHNRGDFYSVTYVRAWIKIAAACPHILFWTYTRSWRIAKMMPSLSQFAELSNVSLFWSTDKDTHAEHGAPPQLPCVRVAHLRSFANEQIPDYVDLVWRDKRGKVQPAPGLHACPQGIRGSNKPGDKIMTRVTCDTCLWCVKRTPSRRDRRKNRSRALRRRKHLSMSD